MNNEPPKKDASDGYRPQMFATLLWQKEMLGKSLQ